MHLLPPYHVSTRRRFVRYRAVQRDVHGRKCRSGRLADNMTSSSPALHCMILLLLMQQ